MIEPGTFLQNRYRIQKQIGQGGMGAVYIATDERFGSTVAIKETFFTDENYSKAFEREARLLNNLRHPALPRVSDHFSDDNGQFLVMEYITGEDLSAKLELLDGAFPLKDVLDWADQLLDALDFLHTQETPVIHRDIKPQNLKLTPRGQIILLDFGLAKGNPTDAQHQTAAKSVFGFSRNYASLEQMQGTGTDPRSDLYSLGATLYHLATGVAPNDALTRAMQVLNGDKDPLKPAHEVHPSIPLGVSEVLQRAMALNANFRPSSAVAMRTMLSENDNAVVDSGVISAIKKPTGGLLTQNTEVFDSVPQSKDTQQAAIKTEVVLNNSADKAETDSVLTQNKPNNRNIQIPVQAQISTKIQPLASGTQNKDSKKGKAIGATALGGLLLVGTALGGLFMFNPNIFSSSVGNANVQQNSNVVLANSSITNSTDLNTLANTAVNTNANISTITGKPTSESKPSEKTVADASTQKTVNQPKETTKVSPEAPADKKEAKVLMEDGEGTKILEDGTVKSSDGTVITPDGKITKNGVIIVSPNGQNRPKSPIVRMPPLTPEQMENLTPAQRRKMRQMMENQKRIMDEQRRQMERRQNPPPVPNRTP